MNEEERQQKLVELQILNQQAEYIRNQIINMCEQVENLQRLREGLKHIGQEKLNNDMFAPLSSGVFIKASLKDTEEVLVAVGAGVFVKKEINEVIEMLQEQEERIGLLLNQTKLEFENFAKSASEIEKELSVEQ